MQYVRTADNQWLFTEIEGESATLALQTINFQIQLSDLYEQVNFADSIEEE